MWLMALAGGATFVGYRAFVEFVSYKLIF